MEQHIHRVNLTWQCTSTLLKCSPDSLLRSDSGHDNSPFPKKLLDSGFSEDTVNSVLVTYKKINTLDKLYLFFFPSKARVEKLNIMFLFWSGFFFLLFLFGKKI